MSHLFTRFNVLRAILLLAFNNDFEGAITTVRYGNRYKVTSGKCLSFCDAHVYGILPFYLIFQQGLGELFGWLASASARPKALAHSVGALRNPAGCPTFCRLAWRL